MPTYHYRCRHCYDEFEVKEKMSDDPLTHCITCGNDTLYRVIGASGIAFLGAGWVTNSSSTEEATFKGKEGEITVMRDKKK